MSLYEIIALIVIIVGALMLYYRGTFMYRVSNFVGKEYILDANYETVIGIVMIVAGAYYIYKYTAILNAFGFGMMRI